MKLEIDEERSSEKFKLGIPIRASLDGRHGTYDIGQLSKQSLLEWLRSRGGDNPWAEDLIGILLGHGHLHDHSKEQ